jgi:hypothetical protein
MPTDIKKPLRTNREGAETIVHSTPLIFAFRQELAPDAPMAGCCGFTGPFPPPLSISRFYGFKNTKEHTRCQSNMPVKLPVQKVVRSSNYLENRSGICYKQDGNNPAIYAVCLEAS